MVRGNCDATSERDCLVRGDGGETSKVDGLVRSLVPAASHRLVRGDIESRRRLTAAAFPVEGAATAAPFSLLSQFIARRKESADCGHK